MKRTLSSAGHCYSSIDTGHLSAHLVIASCNIFSHCEETLNMFPIALNCTHCCTASSLALCKLYYTYHTGSSRSKMFFHGYRCSRKLGFLGCFRVIISNVDIFIFVHIVIFALYKLQHLCKVPESVVGPR